MSAAGGLGCEVVGSGLVAFAEQQYSDAAHNHNSGVAGVS